MAAILPARARFVTIPRTGVARAIDFGEQRAQHLVDWYRTHGFRSVDDVRHAGKRYRSLMLSKPIAQVAPLAELWWAPHRTFVDPLLR